MKLSVVMPLHNEAEHLADTLEVVRGVLADLDLEHELVLIDDGSTDRTWDVLCSEARRGDVRAFRLSRRFGKELALCAGLEHARGDAVLVMDGDRQHPPSLIPAMVRAWRDEGYEVVEGVKSQRGDESRRAPLQAGLFYQLLRRLSGIDLEGASDFKLLDRKVVDAWAELSERNVFFRGMSAWLGFRRKVLPFDVAPRAGGRTAWSTLGLVRLAVNGITSFSSLPVHVITLMGLVFLLLAAVLGANSLRQKFAGIAVDGFTTVNLLLLILGSMLMIGLGVLGEYVSKIYDEVKGRPRYIVADSTEKDSGPK